MPMPSRYDLVDRIIPEGAASWLLEARERGDSFETIARRLSAEHAVPATAETVRQWLKRAEAETAAKAAS